MQIYKIYIQYDLISFALNSIFFKLIFHVSFSRHNTNAKFIMFLSLLVLCMKTHVFFQIIESIASAIAVVAFIGHQITVYDHMTVQMADLLETLAANGAGIRTLVHVRRRDVCL